jgi:histone H3
MNPTTNLEILNIKSIDNKYKDSDSDGDGDSDSEDNDDSDSENGDSENGDSENGVGDSENGVGDGDSENGDDENGDSEISDFESDNNYDTKLKVKEEEFEESEDEELGELEDYETDIDSDEPYSEYSDSEEDNDIQELEDSLFDTELNEQNDSESESETNEDKIIKEISHLQNTTHNLIPRQQFKLLCYEILQDFAVDHYFSTDAIDAIQAASEDYMIEVFQKSNEISINGKRKTIQPKDMVIAKKYRREYE